MITIYCCNQFAGAGVAAIGAESVANPTIVANIYIQNEITKIIALSALHCAPIYYTIILMDFEEWKEETRENRKKLRVRQATNGLFFYWRHI